MRIYIVTENLPSQYHFDPTRPVRGTEKFYVETCRSLVRLGHEPILVTDAVLPEMQWAAEWPGFAVLPRHRFSVQAPTQDKVLVCNPRTRDDLSVVPCYYPTIWSNLAMEGIAVEEWLRAVCGPRPRRVVTISQYQRSNYAKRIQTLTEPVGHGIDETVYHTEARTGGRRVVYSSSPDRGLAALQHLWDDFDIEHRTGYALVWTDYRSQAQHSDDAVADLLRSADYWIHPGLGTELFGLTAIEAQACGCTPIVVPVGGLSETVRFGHRFPDFTALAQGLIPILRSGVAMSGIDRHSAQIPTWDDITSHLLDVL
jgi:hypothetical protein